MDPERLRLNRCHSLEQIDREGLSVCIRCKKCKRARWVAPRPLVALAKLRLWSTTLIGIGNHLRCNKCNTRYPEVSASTQPAEGQPIGITSEQQFRDVKRRLRG